MAFRKATIIQAASTSIIVFTLWLGYCVPASAQSPSTTLDQPSDNSAVSGDITLQGTGSAPSGVDYVELTFKQNNTGQYWNGSTWQSDWIRYPVRVTPPGGTEVTWQETVPASALTTGSYLSRAWSRAVNGNGDPVGDAQVIINWTERGIVSPVPQSEFSGSSEAFSWIGASDDDFWIYSGSSIGLWDYYHSGFLPSGTSSVTVTNLPIDGSTVWIRLWYRQPGQEWKYVDQSYTAAREQSGDRTLTSPIAGSTLRGSQDDFHWTGVAGDNYRIDAGPVQGSNSYHSGENLGAAASATIAGLPVDGSTVWLRLWYRPANGDWDHIDQSYVALPAGGSYLVFAEEFSSFNEDRWQKEFSTYGDGNNELQCYTRQQVSVEDGKLVLLAEKRTETCPSRIRPTRQYTSGMVRSRGVTFSPGQYIEYRVKLTPNDSMNQAGLWPAFWTSGWAGGGWPLGGEWDGLEVMTAVDPARASFNLHFSKPDGSHGHIPKHVNLSERFSDNWHTLGFRYGDDGVMNWYLDGEMVYEVNGASTQQGWPAPFNESMTELKINLALGGNPGPLDDAALPATYEIDYVRIYGSAR